MSLQVCHSSSTWSESERSAGSIGGVRAQRMITHRAPVSLLCFPADCYTSSTLSCTKSVHEGCTVREAGESAGCAAMRDESAPHSASTIAVARCCTRVLAGKGILVYPDTSMHHLLILVPASMHSEQGVQVRGPQRERAAAANLNNIANSSDGFVCVVHRRFSHGSRLYCHYRPRPRRLHPESSRKPALPLRPGPFCSSM